MSTDRKLIPISEWVVSLGALCAGQMTEEEATARTAAYVTGLTEEFDRKAFCMASVRYVAKNSPRGWPNFGHVCAMLTEWWKENQVSLSAPRLSAPEQRDHASFQDKLDADDRQFWEEKLADLAQRPHPDYRWVRAMEISRQVNQADSFPRPWIVPLLRDIIQQAEEDGADTTQHVRPPVPYPGLGNVTMAAALQQVPGMTADFKAGADQPTAPMASLLRAELREVERDMQGPRSKPRAYTLSAEALAGQYQQMAKEAGPHGDLARLKLRVMQREEVA